MAEPNWLNKAVPTRDRSLKQEKRLAGTLGGKTTAGSGSTFGENDVLTDQFEVEAKTTLAKSFKLTLADWRKAEKKCRVDRSVLMVVSFEEEKLDLVVMDLAEYIRLFKINPLDPK